MTIHLTKTQIRQECFAHRKALSAKYIAESSAQIIQQIVQTQAYQNAQHIAWYFPVRGEVDLSLLWQAALNAHKACYFPSIQADQTLLFLPYHQQTSWLSNKYGISEPNTHPSTAKALQKIDLIFVPLVAFDAQCMRLGMGKGYYDKALQACTHPIRMGVAYDWQKYPALPTDPWDIQLHQIITEKKRYAPAT